MRDARPPGVEGFGQDRSLAITSCEQKRSSCVASSCFSFFLSGLLFAFIMTFPLTFLCVRH
jgi:hypothetical protein